MADELRTAIAYFEKLYIEEGKGGGFRTVVVSSGKLLADYAAAQLAAPPSEGLSELELAELENWTYATPVPGRAAAEIRSLRRQLAKARQEAADANAKAKHWEEMCAAVSGQGGRLFMDCYQLNKKLAAARADAERLRKELERCRDSFGSAGWYQQMAIVNHVLAAAPDAGPSDDAEPVDADWLLDIGFSDSSLVRGWKRFELCGDAIRILFRACVGGWDAPQLVVGTVARPGKPTRGDVRRLCSTLGIPLSDAAKESHP